MSKALRRVSIDEFNQIDDNAKRSVSIRINTSDYGRVKWLARQLRAKESDVFRFLLRSGLESVAPMYDSTRRTQAAIVSMLTTLGPELAQHFKLDPKRLQEWAAELTAGTGLEIAAEDLELLQMLPVSADFVRMRLAALTGAAAQGEDVRQALASYLVKKYSTAAA